MLSRRHFLRASGAALGTLVISTGLSGCGSSNASDPVIGETPLNAFDVSFEHGVASGDPLQDRVIIWTRATPATENASQVHVAYQVSTDEGFSNIVHDGVTTTTPDSDYTIKIDLVGLTAGETYYYRFRADAVTSPVGMTKTLPEGDVSQVKLAVFSCANYPAGFFNVYGHAAARGDLDAVVHLGDYIYEYGVGGYATERADEIGRPFTEGNDTEILTLADYRTRYASYRKDNQLQTLHATVPFIIVWDDHEVANDAWREGAENHNEGEGDFDARKQAALKAYFEWLPIRPVIDGNLEVINRSFSFGNLLDLHMLDTRIVGRDKQLDYAHYIDPTTGQLDQQTFIQDISATDRTLLGQDQLLWLQDKVVSSTGTWQVLGQQVLMGKINVPAEILLQLANPGPQIVTIFNELAIIKSRMLAGDPTVTPEERARVETQMPYNLDAWDGYPYERELIYGAALQANKNLVVLAGDTHNAWSSNLISASGHNVGVEFATASVSSPGLEDALSLDTPSAMAFEQGLNLLVDHLEYSNLENRGYMVVTFTVDAAKADWIYVDNIFTPEYAELSPRGKSLQVLPGLGNRTLVEVS